MRIVKKNHSYIPLKNKLSPNTFHKVHLSNLEKLKRNPIHYKEINIGSYNSLTLRKSTKRKRILKILKAIEIKNNEYTKDKVYVFKC